MAAKRFTSGQLREFAKLMGDLFKSLEFNLEDVQCVLTSKEFWAGVKALVMRVRPSAIIESLADLIAAGKYDWVNSDITQDHFPAGQGPVAESEPVLVHLGRVASTDEVLRHMDERGLRPATAEEILVFGAKNPDEQRKYPIAALGSVWVHPDGYRAVACLGSGGRERRLGLGWCDFGWRGVCRFLAFRK